MFPTTSLVSLLCVFVIILTTKNRIGFGAVRRPPPCYHSIELTNNDPLVWRLAERCQPTLARIVGQAASQARLRHTTGRMHGHGRARPACIALPATQARMEAPAGGWEARCMKGTLCLACDDGSLPITPAALAW
jgi:hypothetical protein